MIRKTTVFTIGGYALFILAWFAISRGVDPMPLFVGAFILFTIGLSHFKEFK